jgi:hypothetical protein
MTRTLIGVGLATLALYVWGFLYWGFAAPGAPPTGGDD